MFLGAKVRRFLQSHNTFSMLFTYHKHGILHKKRQKTHGFLAFLRQKEVPFSPL